MPEIINFEETSKTLALNCGDTSKTRRTSTTRGAYNEVNVVPMPRVPFGETAYPSGAEFNAVLRSIYAVLLLPFDCCGRFRSYIIHYSVCVLNFVHDAV